MAHDIFISYAHEDEPVAEAVCAALEAERLRCWIAPRDVLAGQEYAEAIIDGISQSRAMVLVFSSRANRSAQVRREVERAVSKNVQIVPFRIEDVPLAKALEYYLSDHQWFDAVTPPVAPHAWKLAGELARLLGAPAAPKVVIALFNGRGEELKEHRLDLQGNAIRVGRCDCVLAGKSPAHAVAYAPGGRCGGNHIVLLDSENSRRAKAAPGYELISRRCGDIVFGPDRATLRNWKNTLLNGRRLKPGEEAALADGSELQFSAVAAASSAFLCRVRFAEGRLAELRLRHKAGVAGKVKGHENAVKEYVIKPA